MTRPRFVPDNFTLAILACVLTATFLPCRGNAAIFFRYLTNVAIALLFFLHGAKLSREAIVAGMTHVRLHAVVFASTFVLFPILGLVLRPVLAPLVTPQLYLGVLFLCALPATVQSSIAFTSLARGNVSAAVCSASASSLLGVFLTPLLVELLLGRTGGAPSLGASVAKVFGMLFLPFVLGQLARRFIGRFVTKHQAPLKLVDQSSILLAVYTAFSESVIRGLWHEVPPVALVGLLVVCAVLLSLALFSTRFAAKRLGFPIEDEITIVFCGSKKSLATGIPMANVLFARDAIGPIVLPLMLFHQLQLMVCSVLAERYARRPDPSGVESPS